MALKYSRGLVLVLLLAKQLEDRLVLKRIIRGLQLLNIHSKSTSKFSFRSVFFIS